MSLACYGFTVSTPVGDPVEAAALGAVAGAGRPAREPLPIGSVEPNIGHLEAGAGVAGPIKTVLALHHDRIPSSTHCPVPSPAIGWEAARLRVATSLMPWPRTGRPRRAGVSSYGYGGVIAHVVLEQAHAATGHPEHRVADQGPMSFPASGTTAGRAATTPVGRPTGSRPQPLRRRRCRGCGVSRTISGTRPWPSARPLEALERTQIADRDRRAPIAGGPRCSP
ncbi:ketoacyl-synthetase C-terminal extension domain-containing protein [Streptomyces sp. NPDC037389]|uniref:ketoacyl-synthetase C-terminal extension domain-containing protein n=1 Tax=Streptomyces sp. NPDC037389 TaxID=3155369 RepID=UPI0033ECE226